MSEVKGLADLRSDLVGLLLAPQAAPMNITAARASTNFRTPRAWRRCPAGDKFTLETLAFRRHHHKESRRLALSDCVEPSFRERVRRLIGQAHAACNSCASVSQRYTVIKGRGGAADPASLRLFTSRRASSERE
jgi:hypothetical protein